MYELALVPIGMLPGIGLLILSTSSRYWTVVSDLLDMSAEQCGGSAATLERRRARLFRNALVSLYVAAAFASASALIGSTLSMLGYSGGPTAAIGAAVAIGCIVFASIELIRESKLSLHIVDLHHSNTGA